VNTVEKLRALKQVVKDRPNNRFDMHVFMYLDKDCGTVCCALGALAESPAGEEMGLKVMLNNDPALCIGFADKSGKMRTGYEAGKLALGITFKDADYLFNPATYSFSDGKLEMTKEMVINRIDEMIIKYSK
jgi:hypothetical protein